MFRKRLPELLLLAGTLAFMAIVGEVGLRVVQKVRYGTPFFTMLPGSRDATFQRSPFLVFGPRVGWDANKVFQHTGNPLWTRFNDMGIRLPGPVPPRQEGEIRVLALGGSTTENVWNKLGIHWSLGLECLLRQRGRDEVRVLNAGMSSYTTAHSLVRYQLDLSDLEPDVVLIMHNINDLSVTYYAAATAREVDPNYLVEFGRPAFTQHVDEDDVVLSRLLHAAKVRLFPSGTGLLPSDQWHYDLTRGEEFFRRNLKLLIEAVRASGATPVLLTMPMSRDPRWVEEARRGQAGVPGLSLLPEPERFHADFDAFNEVIRDVGKSEGVTVVDMEKRVGDPPGDFADMVHYTTDGIRTFSRALDAAADGFLPPPTGAVLSDTVTCQGVF